MVTNGENVNLSLQKNPLLADFLFAQMCYTAGQKPMNFARNTVIMLLGSIGQKIVSLAYFGFLVRQLSVSEAGDYTAALAFSTLFVVFIDLGLNNVLIREGAQKTEQLNRLTNQILALKFFTSVIAYTALMITAYSRGFEAHFIILVSIAGLAMLSDALHLTFYGYLRARGQMTYEAAALSLSQFGTLIIGGTALLLGARVRFLLAAFVITSLLNVVYSYSRAKKHGFILQPTIPSRPQVVTLTKTTWPFGLAIIFGRFYSYSDIALLKILKGSSEVALYSTPSKISFAFQFIPLSFVAALYPHLSELFVTNKEQFRQTLSMAIKYLLLIAAPISTGIFLLAQPIIILAFTDKYLGSVPSLQILIFSLIFSFISFPLGAALNASGFERRQTLLTGATLLINIASNLIFIPKFGATGAAYGALVGNGLLGTLGFLIIPAQLRPRAQILVPVITKLSLSLITMSAAIITIYQKTNNLLVTIIVGGSVYTGMLLATKLLSLTEIKNLHLSSKL